MNMRIPALFGLILGFFTIAPATGAPVHVEIIVFANNTQSDDAEWFLIPEEVIRIEPLVDEDISEPEFTNQIQPLTSNIDPQPVQAYLLTDFAKAIEAHPNYELLNFLSWVQEPVPRSRTKPVSLDIPLNDSFLSDELLLAGEASVHEIAQLLQIEINLTYKPAADEELDLVYLPEAVKRYRPQAAFLMDERRQIHIDDIHYFDHPKFGVVFTIVRPEQLELYIQ